MLISSWTPLVLFTMMPFLRSSLSTLSWSSLLLLIFSLASCLFKCRLDRWSYWPMLHHKFLLLVRYFVLSHSLARSRMLLLFPILRRSIMPLLTLLSSSSDFYGSWLTWIFCNPLELLFIVIIAMHILSDNLK